MNEIILKPEQAAEALGIAHWKLYELLATGELESVRVGELRRIPVDALDECVLCLRDEQPDALPA